MSEQKMFKTARFRRLGLDGLALLAKACLFPYDIIVT